MSGDFISQLRKTGKAAKPAAVKDAANAAKPAKASFPPSLKGLDKAK